MEVQSVCYKKLFKNENISLFYESKFIQSKYRKSGIKFTFFSLIIYIIFGL